MTDEHELPDDEDLVQIYSTASISDGSLAKGLLETDGIPVWMKGPSAGDPYPTTGMLLFVAKEDEAAARELMKEVQAGELEGAGDSEAAPNDDA